MSFTPAKENLAIAIENGDISEGMALAILMNWTSDSDLQNCCDSMPDWEGTGLPTDEQEGDDEDDEDDLTIITAPQYPTGKSEIINLEASRKGLLLDEWKHGSLYP